MFTWLRPGWWQRCVSDVDLSGARDSDRLSLFCLDHGVRERWCVTHPCLVWENSPWFGFKAGVILANHPLAIQLQSCHSIESITTVLQGHAQAFSESRGSDTVLKSIKSTVSILIRLSATASLGNSDTIDLVRHKALMAHSTALTVFTAISTCESNMCWSRYLT